MNPFVIRSFVRADLLDSLRQELDRLHLEEPYREQIHPKHGDLRPQRIPVRNFKRDDTPGRDIALSAEDVLSRRSGQSVRSEERYFLHYPPGTLMHEHTDPDPRGQHWRCGVVITPALRGGTLLVGGEWYGLEAGDAYFFDAQTTHAVSEVVEGERNVLTIALFMAKKKAGVGPRPRDYFWVSSQSK